MSRSLKQRVTARFRFGGWHCAWVETFRGRVRRVTTRPINGIDQDVKLNRALYTRAARMAELKKAA